MPPTEAVVLDAQMIEGFVEHFLLERFHEKQPIADCHRDWWTLCCDLDPHIAFAAPRGHAKSTAVNHAYGLGAALFRAHPFQLKVSKTYALACEKIEQAKQEILTNEKIRVIFEIDDVIRDRENDFIVAMKDGYKFRMMALGMNQATRGLSWGTMRPTLILGDDMEDDEEVMSKDRRAKSMRWIMNTLLPMGGDATQIRIFGTILHNDSALVRLCKLWKSKIWEACDDKVSEASILWPAKFSRERLLQIKGDYVKEQNLIGFNMEYRNIATDTTSGFFKPEDFRPIQPEDEKKKMIYYVGMDFAITEEQRSDSTVMVVAGLDSEGFLYIVDVVRGQWADGNEIIDEMFVLERAYRPEEWFVEEGVIRKALGAALELRMRAEDDGRGLYLNLTLMSHGGRSKRSRASNIQARIRGKGVKFHREASWFPYFEDELLQFDRGKHDDQVDAIAYLGIGLSRMVTPLTEKEEEDKIWQRESREHLSMGRSSTTGY